MSDLIVAGFDDAHTAFLARAALARLQTKLSLPMHDLALVSRDEAGRVSLSEAAFIADPGVEKFAWIMSHDIRSDRIDL